MWQVTMKTFDSLEIQADPLTSEQFVKFLQEQDRIWAAMAKSWSLRLE